MTKTIKRDSFWISIGFYSKVKKDTIIFIHCEYIVQYRMAAEVTQRDKKNSPLYFAEVSVLITYLIF